MKPVSLILAVIFIIVGIMYFAGIVLPHHVKHGVVALVLAVLCLVWYRFQSAAPAR